jgi:hypothetical protein
MIRVGLRMGSSEVTIDMAETTPVDSLDAFCRALASHESMPETMAEAIAAAEQPVHIQVELGGGYKTSMEDMVEDMDADEQKILAAIAEDGAVNMEILLPAADGAAAKIVVFSQEDTSQQIGEVEVPIALTGSALRGVLDANIVGDLDSVVFEFPGKKDNWWPLSSAAVFVMADVVSGVNDAIDAMHRLVRPEHVTSPEALRLVLPNGVKMGDAYLAEDATATTPEEVRNASASAPVAATPAPNLLLMAALHL